MGRAGIVVAMVSAVTLVAGCESDYSGPVAAHTPPQYEAVVLTFENERGERIDLIEEGASFELTLDEEASTFESDFAFGSTVISRSGSVVIEGDRMIFGDDPFEDDDLELEREFVFEEVGDLIILEDPTSAFDVDGDGFSEVASMEVQLALQ